MRRFLIDPVPPGHLTIELGKEECHHIQRVLRLKQGDTIELFDGQGMVHQATITALEKRVTVTIQSSRQIVPPLPRLHLHLGLLKGKKMDLLVQKATELGVHALHPFTSDFTEARPPREQKKERWHKISLEACKQCGRNWPLALTETSPLEKQLHNLHADATSLLFWEDEKKTGPGDIMLPPGLPELHLFIGPEGGFSAAEADRCQEKMSAVSLGPLTLRAETAVITALSLALFLSGRMDHHQ